MSYYNNGVILPASLSDGSSNTSTWYLPMTNYTGMILVGQRNSYDISNNFGFGYWFPVSSIGATDSSNNYVSFYCDNMTVNYNGGGLYPMYGLEFTNVDLSEYSLNVMFGGLTDTTTTFAFTSENPNPNP